MALPVPETTVDASIVLLGAPSTDLLQFFEPSRRSQFHVAGLKPAKHRHELAKIQTVTGNSPTGWKVTIQPAAAFYGDRGVPIFAPPSIQRIVAAQKRHLRQLAARGIPIAM
jgi:hypothetical protein